MKRIMFSFLTVLMVGLLVACGLDDAGGFKFQLSENGNYYIVVGIDDIRGNEVIVPSEYKGLPVRAIADRAFDGCEDLTSIVMPESIITVGNSVFFGCDQLVRVSMPSIISMDKGVFTGCFSIKDLTIPTDFLTYAKNQPLERLTITCVNSTIVNASAFSEHKTLKEVTVSMGITEIQKDAFEKCELLESVVLPKGLCKIGQRAFASCPKLQDVVLPSTLEQIHLAAFKNCTALTDIVIPGSVGTIGDAAFYGCSSLKYVIIEEGVKSIGGYDDLPPGVFEECNIEEIIIPESVVYINEGSFKKNPLERAIFKKTAGWKIGASSDNLLASDIFLAETDMADATFAADILLKLSGSRYNYLSCK